MKGSRGKIWQESTKQEGKIEHLVSGLAGLGCLLDWTVGGLVGFVVLLFCWCLLPCCWCRWCLGLLVSILSLLCTAAFAARTLLEWASLAT